MRRSLASLLVIGLVAACARRDSPVARAPQVPPRAREAAVVRAPPEPSTLTREASLAEKLEQLATHDADAAANLLRSLDETERRRVVAVVLLDAARRPRDAVSLANEFVHADPTVSMEHGYSLVWVLTRVGEFEAALSFVERQRARPDEAEDPSKWLNRLFATWAERQPELAAARATLLVPESLRGEALHAVASVWRQRDPAAYAAFVQRLPAGPERDALND